MNAGHWIEHFRQNQNAWTEPDWESPGPFLADEELERRRLLADSLATFQLGESGGGSHIRRFVRQSGAGEDYQMAVALFVREEQRHSEILAGMVGRLGGKLKRRHWANSAFRLIRNRLGLGFNIQVLLTAELIAEAYYGLLGRRIPDPPLQSACAKIVRDETKHIAFHREFFRSIQRRWLPMATALWSAQFQTLFLFAESLVWLDHGRCLRAFGIGRREFRDRARAGCRRFLFGVAFPGGGDGLFEGGSLAQNSELVAKPGNL